MHFCNYTALKINRILRINLLFFIHTPFLGEFILDRSCLNFLKGAKMHEYKKCRGLVAFVAIAFGMLGYCEICRKAPFITSFDDKTAKSQLSKSKFARVG